MANIELKRCPFCGRTASLEERPLSLWIVRCDARFLPNAYDMLCPVNMRTREQPTPEQAADVWNTRFEDN